MKLMEGFLNYNVHILGITSVDFHDFIKFDQITDAGGDSLQHIRIFNKKKQKRI